ncbi:MAG: TIGR02281 family clan AA aspartic protease [Thiomargarita sp.]|nr:TIGR02281 family clan AA aspartic protease [Thiomargarita sp.]
MNNSTQGIGKGMIYAAWIFILILLALFFQNFLDKQNNPNQNLTTEYNNGVREVVLQRNKKGHYVATGTINNKPVTFFLDTGATNIAIPKHIADPLNLEPGFEMQAMTANGIITTYSTILNEVALGEIKLENVRASINPHDQSDEILLGMSFLKHLEFTQRGDTLILRQYMKY